MSSYYHQATNQQVTIINESKKKKKLNKLNTDTDMDLTIYTFTI